MVDDKLIYKHTIMYGYNLSIILYIHARIYRYIHMSSWVYSGGRVLDFQNFVKKRGGGFQNLGSASLS